MNKRAYILLLLVLSTIFDAFSQELPPIENYTIDDYQAENQNWAISQSSNRFIYTANNKGLLEFDGARWRLYPSPNESILRSVLAKDSLIYTGAYMDFGVWEPNNLGGLSYQSLADDSFSFIEDEQFWNIQSLQEFVIFQSLDRIYIYNTLEENFNIISPERTILKLYKADNEIYVQLEGSGLFKISSGKLKLVSNDNILISNIITGVFDMDNQLLILTANSGFFELIGNRAEPWQATINAFLKTTTVYNSIQLSERSIAIGTIANGLFVVDNQGEMSYKINQDSGLGDNTVLNLFEDIDKNIWVALDNGIDCINRMSPFSIYSDEIGVLGTVYDAQVFNGNLYLGTNQGLFVSEKNINNPAFKLISGTQGQVWTLDTIDGTLFCGHNNGTYVIDNKVANKISDVQGAWHFEKIPNMPNLILQGNYNGLNILIKNTASWTFRNKISGFDNSSKHFAFVNERQVLVNHEYKGIFNISIDADYRNAISVRKDSTIDKGAYSGLTTYNGDILYSYKNGILKYDKESNGFKKDSIYSSLFSKDSYTTGKLVNEKTTNTLWGFSENKVTYFEQGSMSTIPTVSSVSLPASLRNHLAGYENIAFLEDENFLIGTSFGYIVLNTSEISSEAFPLRITSLQNASRNSQYTPIDLSQDLVFKPKQNYFKFNYSVTEFDKHIIPRYQYKLEGYDEQWSDWTTLASQTYENLEYGQYKFMVKAKTGTAVSKTVSHKFEISRPWFASITAIIGYSVLGLLLIFFMDRIYKRRQRRELNRAKRKIELKELANQKQQVSFENENLKKDMEMKSKELAISTMSLIKKNEFLNSIKDELVSLKTDANINPIIKIIDKNIGNNDDWQFFEDAFNNADKDFLKTVKTKHPLLTPNDLKLCAYLRLNLSSKEIAPLLNISPRSVEVKRYRLRKKMELTREDSLTGYILSL